MPSSQSPSKRASVRDIASIFSGARGSSSSRNEPIKDEEEYLDRKQSLQGRQTSTHNDSSSLIEKKMADMKLRDKENAEKEKTVKANMFHHHASNTLMDQKMAAIKAKEKESADREREARKRLAVVSSSTTDPFREHLSKKKAAKDYEKARRESSQHSLHSTSGGGSLYDMHILNQREDEAKRRSKAKKSTIPPTYCNGVSRTELVSRLWSVEADLQASRSETDRVRDEMNEAMANLENEVEEAEDRGREMQQQVELAHSRVDGYKQMADAAVASAEEANSLIKRAKARVGMSTGMNANTVEVVSGLEMEKKELEARLRKAEELRHEVKSLSSRLEQAHHETLAVRGELESGRLTAKVEVEALQQALEAQQAQSRAALAQQEEELVKLRATLERETSERKQLQRVVVGDEQLCAKTLVQWEEMEMKALTAEARLEQAQDAMVAQEEQLESALETLQQEKEGHVDSVLRLDELEALELLRKEEATEKENALRMGDEEFGHFRRTITYGFEAIKHPRHGQPKVVRLWTDQSFKTLCWSGRRGASGLDLTTVLAVLQGRETEVLHRTGNNANANRYLSLITSERTLDLELDSVEKKQQLADGLHRLLLTVSQAPVYTGLPVELPDEVRVPLSPIEDNNDTDEEPRSPGAASTPSRTPIKSEGSSSLATPTRSVSKLATLKLGGSTGKANKDDGRHSRSRTLW